MADAQRSLRDLHDPIAVLAFSGWNDAGSAATDALGHLLDLSDATRVFSLDSDDFYDFQVHRPAVRRPRGSGRVIEWPSTDVWIGELSGRELVLITGPEPNLRWRSYATSLISVLRSARPSLVLCLGALLADNAHTRPVPVTRTSADPELAERLGLDMPTYEGPTGMTGIMADHCHEAGFDTISLWAAVPHYVAQPPHPRATQALLGRIEDLTDLSIDLGDLPELVRAWDRGVAELINDDPELAGYVASLEADQDEAELPEATGDAIAAEFQRYLRRRGDQ
ncbi:PAC2 family protein [Granulicoccus sp. GXG6511]|uniref:PAC2 family protein n=1 Tax=Granulicoccus sp. GXG6511 TaxID=3381351 RepID=UPI003D7DE6A7